MPHVCSHPVGALNARHAHRSCAFVSGNASSFIFHALWNVFWISFVLFKWSSAAALSPSSFANPELVSSWSCPMNFSRTLQVMGLDSEHKEKDVKVCNEGILLFYWCVFMPWSNAFLFFGVKHFSWQKMTPLPLIESDPEHYCPYITGPSLNALKLFPRAFIYKYRFMVKETKSFNADAAQISSIQWRSFSQLEPRMCLTHLPPSVKTLHARNKLHGTPH